MARAVSSASARRHAGKFDEIVAAEADGGDAQAGAAEVANLHGSFLWEWNAGRDHIVARAPSSRSGQMQISLVE